MTSPDGPPFVDPRIANYLEALSRALYGLPDDVRGEVFDEIRQHIDDELAQHGGDVSAISGILDRLGDPVAIAREAGAAPMMSPPPRRPGRAHDIAAVVLLAIGGFIVGIGWVVGLILLWTSRQFSRADKVIGTFLIPGGFAAAFLFVGIGAVLPVSAKTCISGSTIAPSGSGVVSTTTTCSGGSSTLTILLAIAVAIVLIIGPIYTTVRLSRRVAGM